MEFFYPYKAWSIKQNKFIYGKLEIKINQKTLEETYYIVNNEIKEEVKEQSICSITHLRAGEEKTPIYDRDIITVMINDELVSFTIRRGLANINTVDVETVLEGVFLESYNGDKYMYAKELIDKPERIEIIGNEIETQMSFKNK